MKTLSFFFLRRALSLSFGRAAFASFVRCRRFPPPPPLLSRRERGGEAEKEGREGPPASSSPRRRLEGPRASSMLSSSRAPPALSRWNGRGRASSSSSSFVPHPHFSQPPLSAQPPPGPTQGTRGKASKEDRTEQGEQAPLNPFVFASYLLQKLAIGSTRSRGRKGERGWSGGRDTLLHRKI